MRNKFITVIAGAFVLLILGCGADQSRFDRPDSTTTKSDSGPPLLLADSEEPEPADELGLDVPAPGANKRLHALLVGCTTYDRLEASANLRGPINDVQMMRTMLIHRFQCPSDQVTALTEGRGESKRPTKANIMQAFKQLTESVKDGDQVVVLLSGHGSQQPNDDPDDPNDPEPDGLDEIFCPADIGGIERDGDTVRIANALSDDEIRLQIGELGRKGAFVWIIIDSCHSGSAARGTEVYRQLAPERLLPDAVLQQARQRARSRTRGVDARDASPDKPQGSGKYVAIYAAQSHEPTVEMPLPSDEVNARWRGLLTFTLAKVLAQSTRDLTYRELVQRIHAEYLHDLGRLGPTPLVEGTGLDQLVLGDAEAPRRSQLIVSHRNGPDWVLNGGRLHGLTKGTIVAVYPAPGKGEKDKVLGHLEIRAAQMVESFARPVAFEELPASETLPVGGRCRPAQVNYGELALRVAVQADDDSSPTVEDVVKWVNRWRTELHIAVEYEEQPERADWLIRSSKGVSLIPAAGWTTKPKEGEGASDLGSGPDGEAAQAWLEDRLKRIARVHRLLKVGGVCQKEAQRGWLDDLLGEKRCDIKSNLERIDEDSQKASPIEWSKQGITLANGDIVALQVKNTGKERIDFSVLFVDSRFGITPLFPQPGTVADNRLNPGTSLKVGPMRVQDDSLGVEHIVVVATLAKGQPVDLSWLAQDSIEQAKTATRGAAGFQHPIGKLMQDVLFSSGKVRGMKMVETDEVRFQVLSWQTVKEGVPPPDSR